MLGLGALGQVALGELRQTPATLPGSGGGFNWVPGHGPDQPPRRRRLARRPIWDQPKVDPPHQQPRVKSGRPRITLKGFAPEPSPAIATQHAAPQPGSGRPSDFGLGKTADMRAVEAQIRDTDDAQDAMDAMAALMAVISAV